MAIQKVEKVSAKLMLSPRKRLIPHTMIITTEQGQYLQSFDKIVCFKPFSDNPVLLDRKSWKKSKTTTKYRNVFLHEDKKTTEEKIRQGVYKLIDLN